MNELKGFEPVAWIDAEGRIYTILPEFMKHKSEYSPIFSADQLAAVVRQRDELVAAAKVAFEAMESTGMFPASQYKLQAAIAKVQP